MLVFYIELILVYIFSLYARLCENKYKIIKAFFVFLIIVILFLVSGLRSGIGDTGMYIYLYKLIGPNYVSNGGYERGFILFFRVLKSISDNPQFMLLVISFITNVFIIWTMKKYPGYFELSTYMYITSGYYLVTMNGIRQCLAAAVMFGCTPLIIKGKFKTYLIIALIMTTIHTSAIVMIPAFFIVRNETWSPKIYGFIVLFLIGLVFYDPMMNLIYSFLGNSKYGEYKNFKEGGANILRVLITAVPVILSYIKRDILKEKWPESNIFVNMALLNLIIMCFSIFNWIFARFTIYTEIYSFVLLANILRLSTRKKERNFLYYGLIVAYFIFFWYEQVFTLKIQYRSNFINL